MKSLVPIVAEVTVPDSKEALDRPVPANSGQNPFRVVCVFRGSIDCPVEALNFLRQQWFKYLKSVIGGITAWSEEIDSKVPRF